MLQCIHALRLVAAYSYSYKKGVKAIFRHRQIVFYQ